MTRLRSCIAYHSAWLWEESACHGGGRVRVAHIVLKRRSVRCSPPSPAVWLEENRRKARSRTGQPENIWSTVALAQPPRTPLHSTPLYSTQLFSFFHRLRFISTSLPSVFIETSQHLITAGDSVGGRGF